jgi:hypothetical protein
MAAASTKDEDEDTPRGSPLVDAVVEARSSHPVAVLVLTGSMRRREGGCLLFIVRNLSGYRTLVLLAGTSLVAVAAVVAATDAATGTRRKPCISR